MKAWINKCRKAPFKDDPIFFFLLGFLAATLLGMGLG